MALKDLIIWRLDEQVHALAQKSECPSMEGMAAIESALVNAQNSGIQKCLDRLSEISRTRRVGNRSARAGFSIPIPEKILRALRDDFEALKTRQKGVKP